MICDLFSIRDTDHGQEIFRGGDNLLDWHFFVLQLVQILFDDAYLLSVLNSCTSGIQLTIIRNSLVRLMKELPPMNIQIVQPRRVLVGLEFVHIFIGILILHCREARVFKIWKPFSKLPCGLR